MPSIQVANNLTRRFQATFAGVPTWAWQFKPPIPLIGRQYRPGRSILVYASAENFNRREWRCIPPFLKPPDAWNRYRIQYERQGRDSKAFFPRVGIQPATDGGLFAAALFVGTRLSLPIAARPRTFLEKIALSNWCKFSIRAELNRDYIGNLPKLIASLPYVVGELAELRPGVVLLPSKVWARPVLQAAMRGASPCTRFVPVPQFNATVVNAHLVGYDTRARRLRKQHSGTPLAEWMANLHGFREASAWRYIACLDDALDRR